MGIFIIFNILNNFRNIFNGKLRIFILCWRNKNNEMHIFFCDPN